MESWEFYKKNPVTHRMNANDAEHFARRAYLYQLIGVPPMLLSGKNVLEFGPGEGHNSIYLASLQPHRYVLVDGDPTALDKAKQNIEQSLGNADNIETCASLFNEFSTDELFDFVVAEACLSIQNENPGELLRHMSSLVKPGGILFITTLSPASYLSEAFRRLSRNVRLSPSAPVDEQVSVMTPLLSHHFETLQGFSRSVEDWIVDNIVQPLHKREMLSLPDAIKILSDEFRFYCSSPQFFSNWGWYKSAKIGGNDHNEQLLANYYRSIINFIDYRVENISTSYDTGYQIDEITIKIWNLIMKSERQESFDIREIEELSNELVNIIEPISPTTSSSVAEAMAWISGGAENVKQQHFNSWWGRGQQFVSFMRRVCPKVS
jgi:2-polyprenyl-3-methyl-5-hydroxy-6-metoxy-1,4-benzoquinol methylase